jgi:cytochrome c peroxidase
MQIRHSLKTRVLPFLIVLTMLLARSPAGANELAELGEALFFDTSLSLNRTQACASCHNPATAFTDSRDNGTGGAVSLGDDGKSLGDRNAPTITYAALIPPFGVDDTGAYAGGTFYDGRAASLVEQAAEPFTNPLEMNLPDSSAVVGRVQENASHVEKLKALFGETVFDDPGTAFRAIVESIVAFERTATFAPFDSKYDRFLRGDYELTIQEELGRKLFYSRIFNCHECHLIDDRELQPRAAFSTHRYFNIGVPVNRDVRAKNGLGTGHVDQGLLDNPAVEDPSQAGKFRVPSLRNVAVTGPYMHNGVFDELETVVLFYNRFILTNPESQTNPETGLPWGDPEVPETVDLQLLRQGQPVSELQVSALVSFLEALTDQRYEHLLDEN